MNLSFNKINEIKQGELSFKGMKGEVDAGNVPQFEFTIPPHKHNEIVTLEVAFLEPDENGGYKTPNEEDFFEGEFFDTDEAEGKTVYNERPIIQMTQEALDGQKAFAYRYRIDSKDGRSTRYYTDKSQTINSSDGGKMNYIELGGGKYGVSPKGGSMSHIVIDSNVIKEVNSKRVTPNNPRNHFNKLGGTLEDLLYMVKETPIFKPFRYVMTNPTIGADPFSSHKYWPMNQYQSDDDKLFKEINVELFKQGKGYVADGAFTSQGLASPMVQRLFKWGDKTGCSEMLRTDGRFAAGVLPDRSANDREDVYANIGVRLVNAKESKDYDASKPTYIQFYDQRLLSEEKQNDTKNLVYDYDKETDDHYDIVKHQDSVVPYYFEIDPNDAKIKEITKDGGNKILLKDIENISDFLTFENSTITTKRNASGATTWDGNVDIIKMDAENKYARNYLLGVSTYWTEMIQKSLISETLNMSEKERKQVAKNNDISPERYEEIKKTIGTEDYESPIIMQGKTAETYLNEFPLHSIKTAPELSGVFMEPDFNSVFYNLKTADGTNVFEKINNIVDETIESAIPEKYKGNEEYKAFATKLYAQDIIKNVIVGAMGPDLIKKDGSIDAEKLKDINIKTFEKHKSNSPQDEINQVSKGLAKGIDAQSAKSIQEKMSKELKKVSLDDFKISEAIVLQGKGGLNWRFDAAKDIGNLDAIRNGEATFHQIWYGDEEHPGVVDFWKTFISNIRDYNPSSYVINEITELGEFYDWQDQHIEMIREYGGDEAVKDFLDMPEEKIKDLYYKELPPYKAEKKFLRDTSSTATSMFDEGFNRFTGFMGADPEKCGNAANVSGNLFELTKVMKEFQNATQPNNSIFAHSFTHNHDKPTPLHMMALQDTGLFGMGDMSVKENPFYSYITKDVTGRSDLSNISSKAVAVGYMLKHTLNQQVTNEDDKQKMNKALQNLANGKRKDSQKDDFNRAEAFGTLPFEIALKDIAKDAGVKNVDTTDIHFNNMKEFLDRQLAMSQVSNAMPGVFTWFNGAEFGQTGFETKNKNVHVDNRNRILRELANDPRYAPYVKRIEAEMGLWQLPGMSAVGGGFTTMLNVEEVRFPEKDKKLPIENVDNFNEYKEAIAKFIAKTTYWPPQYEHAETQISSKLIFSVLDDVKGTADFDSLAKEAFGISKEDMPKFEAEYEALKKYFTEAQEAKLQLAPSFAYDEKGSRTIVVATNNGQPIGKHVRDQQGSGASYEAPVNVSVATEKQTYEVDDISIVDSETGLAPMEDGTILKRKVYNPTTGKYEDENKQYVVKDGKITDASGAKIKISDATAVFYAPKEGQKYPYMASLYNGAH